MATVSTSYCALSNEDDTDKDLYKYPMIWKRQGSAIYFTKYNWKWKNPCIQTVKSESYSF